MRHQKANKKMAQIMAEMRETHRQENKTLAEKVVEGILVMNQKDDKSGAVCDSEHDDGDREQGFWWAALPTRRA